MSKNFTLKTCLLGCLLALLVGSPAFAQYEISGTVTDQSPVPVMDVEIRLYDDMGNPLGIPLTLTDAAGFYSITGVPPGTYELEFRPPSASGLVAASVTNVIVTGNTTVNAMLEIGLLFYGYVRDNSMPPVGLLNIDLNVYDQTTGNKLFTPSDNTDGVGYYEILVPAGLYRVRWRSAVGDPWVPIEVDSVLVTGPTTMDVTMQPGFVVSGLIQDGNGSAVVNADLDFTDEATGLDIFTPKDNTDASGQYEVIVPGGTYTVEVEPDVADRLVAGVATGVVVASDMSLNMVLQPGVAISGTVTRSGGSPVEGADIDVTESLSGVDLVVPGDNTDAAGFYEIIVPTGLLDIAFQPPVSSMTASVEYLGQNVTGDLILNVVVPDGILLEGLVEDGGGTPVVNADIDVKYSSTGLNVPLSGEHTDLSGLFAVVVEPGTYDIQVEPPKVLRLAAKEFLSTALSTDTYLPVTLEAGWMISGYVTDSAGGPAIEAMVDAIVSATGDTLFTPGHLTDSSGYYEIVVTPQTYHLLFIPSLASGITDSVLISSVGVGSDLTIDASFQSGGSSNPPIANFVANLTSGPAPLTVNFTDLSIYSPYAWNWNFGDGLSDQQHPGHTYNTPGTYTVSLAVLNANGTDQLTITDYIVVTGGGGGCCSGSTGDVNQSGEDTPTIGDVAALVDFLFISRIPPVCLGEADINQSGGSQPIEDDISIGDVAVLTDHLFITKAPLPTCL